jgi:hypothetical protein
VVIDFGFLNGWKLAGKLHGIFVGIYVPVFPQLLRFFIDCSKIANLFVRGEMVKTGSQNQEMRTLT